MEVTKDHEVNKLTKKISNAVIRWDSIIDGSPFPQFVIDKDHNVIYWNKALEEYSKIKSADIIDTEEHWKVFYSEKRPCLVDLLVDEDFEGIEYWFSDSYKKSELVDGAYEAESSDTIKGKKIPTFHCITYQR
ncbi:PAS domain-containing protein [Methanobacterium petrolearium]|uniref:PAS domain-containing protein n=1 Tax=Methanobacterium petrolearium TaxID=710190 RepID=UPI0030816F9E|nr:hypothetical protein GCM10025861_21170 [Methanobacterium petrolearium]